MLFNLRDDPHEQHNLATDHPQEIETARAHYRAWHAAAMSNMPDGYTEDPLETALREVPLHCQTDLDAYCRRLEATGRGQWVEQIRQRARSRPDGQ